MDIIITEHRNSGINRGKWIVMNYEGILEFKGTWRKYQARVLEHADRYISDGKIHIVAAPGSGKTTLGIEMIRRLNGKALILAPSITIREQWIARIEEAFLCEGIQGEEYLSQNLKQPKAITVVTYQALHSAMTRFQGMQEGEWHRHRRVPGGNGERRSRLQRF